jgi:hypothetical protein
MYAPEVQETASSLHEIASVENYTMVFIEMGQVANQQFVGGLYNYSFIPNCIVGYSHFVDDIWLGTPENEIKFKVDSDGLKIMNLTGASFGVMNFERGYNEDGMYAARKNKPISGFFLSDPNTFDYIDSVMFSYNYVGLGLPKGYWEVITHQLK